MPAHHQVSVDAARGWSPPLGIMRLLIDHWHLSSLVDLAISAQRFALQVRHHRSAYTATANALAVGGTLLADLRNGQLAVLADMPVTLMRLLSIPHIAPLLLRLPHTCQAFDSATHAFIVRDMLYSQAAAHHNLHLDRALIVVTLVRREQLR
jgi:hypothetical protein